MIISRGLDLAGSSQSVSHEHVLMLHIPTCVERHVHTQRLAVSQNLILLLFIAGRDSIGTAAESHFPYIITKVAAVLSFFLIPTCNFTCLSSDVIYGSWCCSFLCRAGRSVAGS